MLPLALREADECKLCMSVHIPLNVAKLIGAHSQLQLDNEADYTKKHFVPSRSFLFFFIFLPPLFLFLCVSVANTDTFHPLLTQPRAEQKVQTGST